MKEYFELSNGVCIPSIGYGTWQTPDGEVATASVKTAIRMGYAHIDAAACYNNEASVGMGVSASGADRRDLFITSKVWNTERGYEKTTAAFNKTCADLGVDYLDLYLIHWPANQKQFDNADEINVSTWQAMIDLYKAGKIRAIGVSNFKPHHLEPLMGMEIAPMVNQIEFHPGMMQAETVEFCRANGIVVEAWSPLGTGRMLGNATLQQVAESYGVSVAQVCIRWCLQHDVLPLPKSVTPERIAQNKDVFGFSISDQHMALIDGLENFGGSGLDPDQVDF